jgi:hypothetical protein
MVPLDNKAALDLAKDILRSVLYTEDPWLASQEDQLDIGNKAWDEVLDAMTVQQRAVEALNSTQYMWECLSRPRERIEFFIHGIVSFQRILWVSKFDNTNYKSNTVLRENKWYAGSTS